MTTPITPAPTRASTLTDAQSLVLSAASQRSDGRLVLPERLHGMAAERLVRSVVRRGLAVAVADAPPRPAPAEELGLTAYRVPPAGLLAIGVVPDGPGEQGEPAEDAIAVAHKVKAGLGRTEPAVPRPGTKSALVLSLLSAEGGATLGDIVVATGWLAHTARAALTGLRQRGYAVERRPGPDGVSLYRIGPAHRDSAGEAV